MLPPLRCLPRSPSLPSQFLPLTLRQAPLPLLSLFLFLSLFLSPALSLWNRRRLIHWNSVSPLSSLFYMCLNHPQSVACYSTELKRPPASCSGAEERGFSWHLTRRRQLSRLDAFPFGERDGTISALLLSNPNGQSS